MILNQCKNEFFKNEHKNCYESLELHYESPCVRRSFSFNNWISPFFDYAYSDIFKSHDIAAGEEVTIRHYVNWVMFDLGALFRRARS